MDKRLMKDLRWDSYVFMKGVNEIQSFLNIHFNNNSQKLLFIIGKGFDIRMNIGIELIAKHLPNLQIKCILIEFDEGLGSSSNKYNAYVEENFKVLKGLNNISLETKKISLWKGRGRNKRRIGDREAAKIFSNYNDFSSYANIIVDISALPRGIYFSLIGKLLSLIDNNKINGQETHNLFVLTSENAKIDQLTTDEDIDDELIYTYGFGGEIELTNESPIIWFPVMGENKLKLIEKAYNKINPDEICPLLPFPSKDPRRSDILIIEYHKLLFEELRIAPQNFLYVPEQNPFEIYRSLSMAIVNYNKTLEVINGCKAVISSFSSKLLSIGVLITAYEFDYPINGDKIGVGILNVDSKGYRLENENELESLKSESELFLTWLTGDPYNL